MTITKVNYYLCEQDGEYYYSAWEDGEHDHNGEIPSSVEPADYLAQEFPGAELREVQEAP